MGLHATIQSQLFMRAITCNVIAMIQSATHTGIFQKGSFMNKALLIAVLIVFGALTAYSVHFSGGLVEFLQALTLHPANWQVFFDLVIVMCLLLVFMKRDAKKTGRPFWPWAIVSLLVGSFGPLLYFITAKNKE
jgi:drug/metabolite transporter (DMT)-like permease